MNDVDGQDRVRSAFWTVATGLLAAAAAAVGDHRVVTLSPVWPVLVGVVCAAGSVVVGRRRAARAAGVFRAAAWLMGGGWVGWCYVYGLWHATTIEALVAATLVMAVVSLLLPMPDGPNLGPAGQARLAITRDPDVMDWEQRLAKVGKAPDAVVTGIEQWPTRAGHTVYGEGADWMELKARERALTVSLRLPRGCGVEVGPGDHSAAFALDVSTKDSLAEPVTYTDTSELTGNGPIPLGRYRDGTTAEATMRLTCSLVVAATNGGKSNHLHSLTAGYVRCPDVLVWHIDLGGAGLALPWLSPWLDDDTTSPVIDWAATTVDEAILMTEFTLQVINQRRVVYRRLMLEHNTDIVPCSPQLPQIRIVIDETAEAAGISAHPKLQANLVRIIQLGRAVGARADVSLLRATAGVIPTDAERQIGLRAVFGVNDDAEIGYALGWHTRLNLGEAAHPGTGWLRLSMAHPIRVFRTAHTARPSTIAAIARACEPRRPRLDEPSLNVPLRDAYLARWERTVPLLTDGAEPAHGRGSPAGSPGGSRSGSLAQTYPSAGGLADDLARLDQTIKVARAAQRLSGMPDEYVDREIERLEDERAAGRLAAPDPATPGDDADDGQDAAKARLLDLLDAAGPGGMSGLRATRMLAAEGHTMTERTVYRWLKRHAIDGGRGSYRHPKYGEVAQ